MLKLTSSFQAGGCTAAFFFVYLWHRLRFFPCSAFKTTNHPRNVSQHEVLISKQCLLRGDKLYLNILSYSYFDYLKPNANQQPREKKNQNKVKHREQKSSKMNLECYGNTSNLLTLPVSSQYH
ncbi:hypothetical protein T4C_5005 [Trichinella pseudospiralis]|uniref:Uncharacterized protein n=1 Tax=Trichinella pseudospiralis TaxID=6337 RepID=A0A0V1KEZ5_TRIPS|nr:hypothetical protein T4C_5005 [Trichinella pseudospiralis]